MSSDRNWASMSVAVVGAGYMGMGIAQVLACAGADVTVVDTDAERAIRAVQSGVEQARRFEGDGLLPEGSAAAVDERTHAAADLPAGVAGADVVVEAVFENLAVKHGVLAAIEESAPREAILASNTSSIPIGALAAAVTDASRLLGVHWFNPPQFVPGVEVIPTAHTRPQITARIVDLLRAAGKAPAVVSDSPGFVGNRLQFALFREAALMVEEGVADADQIDEVVKGTFGYRLPFYGPFAIADMAGLDVYAGAYQTLAAAFGARFTAPRQLTELVAQGRLGVKAGGGFLDLDADETKAMIERRDKCYAALLELVQRDTHGAADRPHS